MKEFIPILGAILGFIGTVIGIIVGYRKWHGDKKNEKYGQFDKDLQEAYRALWEKVEAVNIKVRIEEVTQETFSQQVQALNSFMLEKGLYIEDSDREHVNLYLKAVYNFQKVVKESGNEEAKIPLGETQTIPASVTDSLRVIADAQQHTIKLRDELRQRIRRVLAGE